MSTTYAELLRDPRWQRKRLEILSRDEWKCRNCGSGEKTLNVHHRAYVWGNKPWEYDEDQLLTLCADCHQATSRATKSIARLVAELATEDQEIVLGFIAGLADTRGFSRELPYSAAIAVGLAAYGNAVMALKRTDRLAYDEIRLAVEDNRISTAAAKQIWAARLNNDALIDGTEDSTW